jgi:glutaredoxin
MYYMITKPDCPYCDYAKKLLEEKGEPYEAFLYTEHPMIQKLMFEAVLKTVPQIWYNNKHIGGYGELVEWFEYNDT